MLAQAGAHLIGESDRVTLWARTTEKRDYLWEQIKTYYVWMHRTAVPCMFCTDAAGTASKALPVAACSAFAWCLAKQAQINPCSNIWLSACFPVPKRRERKEWLRVREVQHRPSQPCDSANVFEL